MNIRTFMLLLTCVLASMSAAEPARYNPEWANAQQSDPAVMDSLQKVVVLCASEPGSEAFNAQWIEWVAANPELDLESTIRTVISKAGSIRSMGLAGVAPAPVSRKMSDGEIAAHMKQLAKLASSTINRQRLPPSEPSGPR